MQKRSAEQVEQLMREYEASGLTRREYCERIGMPMSTFDYYRQRASRKAAAQRRATSKRALVKVEIEHDTAQPQGAFTLVLRNGRRIESAWSFSEQDLERLIRLAETI
jgi:hypothetical protein